MALRPLHQDLPQLFETPSASEQLAKCLEGVRQLALLMLELLEDRLSALGLAVEQLSIQLDGEHRVFEPPAGHLGGAFEERSPVVVFLRRRGSACVRLTQLEPAP